MALLDDPRFVARLAQVVGRQGGPAGTGQATDARKVSEEIVRLVFAELTESQGGIQIQTALATLGALAGFATQMAIREHFVKPGKMAEDKAFAIIKGRDGGLFYFGDLLNEGLFRHKPGALSVYALVAGAAQQLGAARLPDIKAILAHVGGTIGTPGFGVPRLPPDQMPRALPIELLDRFWNPLRNLLVVGIKEPSQWPFVLAHAAQNVIIQGKDVIDPGLAAQIAMEAAAPMAMVDPARVRNAYLPAG
jgi:hypothetical protein